MAWNVFKLKLKRCNKLYTSEVTLHSACFIIFIQNEMALDHVHILGTRVEDNLKILVTRLQKNLRNEVFSPDTVDLIEKI